MNWGKIILSTVLAGIVMSVVFWASGFTAMALNPGYNPMELGGMRAMDDPIMNLFYAHPFVLALAFSISFHFFMDTFGKAKPVKRGVHFGLLMWMLLTLPSMFLICSSMDYGETFLLTGTVSQLIEFVAAGVIISWIFGHR